MKAHTNWKRTGLALALALALTAFAACGSGQVTDGAACTTELQYTCANNVAYGCEGEDSGNLTWHKVVDCSASSTPGCTCFMGGGSDGIATCGVNGQPGCN